MTEEEQKAIELLKEEISRPVEVPEDKFNTFILYNIENTKIILNLISKLQAELDLKDKVIDLVYNTYYQYVCKRPMSCLKDLKENGFDKNCNACDDGDCEQCIKQYFYEKVEELGWND